MTCGTKRQEEPTERLQWGSCMPQTMVPLPEIHVWNAHQSPAPVPPRRLPACPSQDLVIGAYIPPEYQQLIMSRCHWEESTGSWSVEHLEWAGNLAR
jgi:hypothetical protein